MRLELNNRNEAKQQKKKQNIPIMEHKTTCKLAEGAQKIIRTCCQNPKHAKMETIPCINVKKKQSAMIGLSRANEICELACTKLVMHKI